jgi:hypothetical protein
MMSRSQGAPYRRHVKPKQAGGLGLAPIERGQAGGRGQRRSLRMRPHTVSLPSPQARIVPHLLAALGLRNGPRTMSRPRPAHHGRKAMRSMMLKG